MAKRKPKLKSSPSLSSKRNLLHTYSWGLFALGVLIYANTLFHDYTLDDAIVIYDNEFTTKGLAGIPALLKYDTFRGFFKVEGKEQLVAGGRYRPLTPVMYAAGVQFLSPKKKDSLGQVVKDKDGDTVFDPMAGSAVKFVGHLVNVLLYGLTGVVLFWLLLRLLTGPAGEWNPRGYASIVALAATLLFVVHPLHTEVVANVKGRDELVSLLGSLAALLVSLHAFYEKKPRLSLAAAGLFFLALLSKENAITFLAVVPLSYYFFTKAKGWKLLVQCLPFLAAAALFLVIRGSVLGWSMGGGLPRELMNNPFLKLAGNQYVDFTAAEKFATIFYTLGKYVQLLLFPVALSHDYYPRAVEIMSFSDWQVILSLLLYAGMGIYALFRLPKKDSVSFGILFYLATLSIASNVVFPIGTNMSERFVYMPSVGFSLVVAVLFYRLAAGKKGLAKPALTAGAVALLLLAGRSVARNFVWKDNFTLFTTDVKTVPGSAKLQNSAGGELITQAVKPENAARKTAMLQEAVQHLTEAIRIHPGYKNAFLLLGNAHNYLQQYELSVQYFGQALRLDSEYTEARTNLGITCREAGRYYGEQKGDVTKALEFLEKACQMRPGEYETLRLLGVAYGISGQGAKAVEFFEKALAAEPQNAGAFYNLGTAYYHQGEIEKANENFQKAKAINPNIEEDRKRQQGQ